ncbi:hypothetical protein [Taklimakanibacter deserti]|uniref:hypothetical protein n=1 Tax=Taklimakanibacter deserti TaxID=2267839 RepID=UPI0013C47079
MRSWFARAADAPAAAGVLHESDNLYTRLTRAYEESGARYRAPLVVAIMSVAFQEYPAWTRQAIKVDVYGYTIIAVFGAGLLLSSLLAAFASTTRLAVAIFIVIAAIAIVPEWQLIANHTYLALWCIPVAILFKESWTSDLYAYYLRMTLGIVMVAAFGQKLLAGTYLDGSFIAYLSMTGTTSERMFSLFCDSASPDPCIVYRLASWFILAWQLVVGILLLLGLNSLLFLAIEIGFLLGAGVYADEMNFQILNIALLCIVFRFGMPIWLLVVSIALLAFDRYGVSALMDFVLNHVG